MHDDEKGKVICRVPTRRDFLRTSAMAGAGISMFGLTNLFSTAFMHTNQRKSQKLGIALVGLGRYSTYQLGPALLETQHCYLSGIVTGSPEKVPGWQEKYRLKEGNIYNYENFDEIAGNPDIDIIYVVLPNSMHAEFVTRAAAAGKHVICEKPMAMNRQECRQMIEACQKADRRLSIGYRLHFDPFNLEMQRLGQKQVYGEVTGMSAGFGFNIGDPTQWRLKKDLAGGGPLVDLGIYCIQGFCYTKGMLPATVTAVEGPKPDPIKFAEVEATVNWQFTFPDGTHADGVTSYANGHNHLSVMAEGGEFGLQPAFSYSGNQGYTPEGPMSFRPVNQQALQMDDFALAVMNNRATPVPGEMGMRDVILIESIYEAMSSGQVVEIAY